MSAVRDEKPFTGRRMLVYVLAFFGVIIAVNMVLMTLALRTDNGLVVRNSYVASQNFNRNQDEARAQAALNWSVALVWNDGELTLTYRDAQGMPLRDLEVTGRVGRPVTARDDRAVVLTRTGSGSYTTELTLGAGFWDVDLTATDAEGQRFRRIFQIRVGEG